MSNYRAIVGVHFCTNSVSIVVLWCRETMSRKDLSNEDDHGDY